MDRIIWADWTKAIGIFLVLWGHLALPQIMKEWIYSFHMPLFLVLSGYFSSNHQCINFGDYFVKYARRLLVPFFVFGGSAYVFWVVKEIVHPATNGGAPSLWIPLLGILSGSGENCDWLYHSIATWFLPCLFSIFILHWFIVRCDVRPTVHLVISLLLSVVGAACFAHINTYFPLGVKSAFLGYPFFVFGLVFRRFERFFVFRLRWITMLFWASVHLVLFYLAGFKGGDLRGGITGFIPLYWALGIAGSLMIVSFSRVLPVCSLVRMLSQNTLVIFCWQNSCSLVLTFVVIQVSPLVNDDFTRNHAIGFLYAWVTLFILSGAGEFVRRRLPWTLGVRCHE